MKWIKSLNAPRLVFLFLLFVMLDHTAFFFAQFEPIKTINSFGLTFSPGQIKGLAMALVFESSIWIMTEKLAAHIESIKPKRTMTTKQRIGTAVDRFFNVYGLALAVCWSVSFVANYSHALAFGQNSNVAQILGISPELAAMVAGGILPFVSLLFSSAIAKTQLVEIESDTELANVKTELTRTKRLLTAANNKIKSNGPLEILADSNSNGRDKILAAQKLWPKMPNNGLAILADVSPSHVTKTIQRLNGSNNDKQ